jgi:hypothetical protein
MTRTQFLASLLAVIVTASSSVASAQLFRNRSYNNRSYYRSGYQAAPYAAPGTGNGYSAPRSSSSSKTPAWKLQKTDPAKYRPH